MQSEFSVDFVLPTCETNLQDLLGNTFGIDLVGDRGTTIRGDYLDELVACLADSETPSIGP